MFPRPTRNRRRTDVAQSSALRAVAAPVLVRVVGVTLVSMAVGGAGLVGWRWASSSPRFGLRELVIEGEVRATEAELVQLGGLAPGVNLLALDVAAVERGLSSHPWVAEARVRRSFPSRLVVEIEEHRAVALLALGELYLVDERGRPFKRATLSDEMDLPLLTGVGREALERDREGALARLERAVVVLDAYQRGAAGREGLSEVHVEPDDELTVVTTRGQEVRLGEGRLEEQLARLVKVRGELEARSLEASVIRLDNRVRPGRVTVQLASMASDQGGRR